MCSFDWIFFINHNIFKDHMSVFQSFFLLNYIPLYRCNTFGVFIHHWMDKYFLVPAFACCE